MAAGTALSARSLSLAPPSLPVLPFPVFAVNREYLYKFIAEISKLARIPFFPELLALLGTPGADLHPPNGLWHRYKSIQSQSQALGRAGNSKGPKAETGMTPSLCFIPVPFSPGGRGRSRLQPAQAVPGTLGGGSGFSLPLFLSLPSMSDPDAAAVEGNLGGNINFSRHFL